MVVDQVVVPEPRQAGVDRDRPLKTAFSVSELSHGVSVPLTTTDRSPSDGDQEQNALMKGVAGGISVAQLSLGESLNAFTSIMRTCWVERLDIQDGRIPPQTPYRPADS